MAAPENIAFDVEFDGQTYKGVVDEGAIAAFEDATDRSIIEVAGVGGRPPKFSLLGAFLAAALSRHHPGLSREDGMRMLRAPGVQEKLLGGLGNAMPQEGDVPEVGASPENPPKRRRRSKGGKTG